MHSKNYTSGFIKTTDNLERREYSWTLRICVGSRPIPKRLVDTPCLTAHVPWLPVVTAADQYYGHLRESCMASHHSMITGRELELVLPVSSIDMNSAFWEIPWHFCNTRVRTKKLICDHLTAIFQYIGMAIMPIKQTENKTCQHQGSDKVSTS